MFKIIKIPINDGIMVHVLKLQKKKDSLYFQKINVIRFTYFMYKVIS